MKIAVISDVTYNACLPDDPMCTSFYGSEYIHAVLAQALVDAGHEVEWFAPVGSTPIGNFHAITLIHGKAIGEDIIDKICVENINFPGRVTIAKNLATCDFVIDMSATGKNVEELKWYHDNYSKFCCYRNGFIAFFSPKLMPNERNYVVPSIQNQVLFKNSGYDSKVIHYGIPDFYCPGDNQEYWKVFENKYNLQKKGYFLFPHRPHPDKGVDVLFNLARNYPSETFVISANTPISEHQMFMDELKGKCRSTDGGMNNVIFCEIPIDNTHHYYKRELFRNAKAVLCPLGKNYFEGFGLTAAEAVGCGTPCIWTLSQSAIELFRDRIDGLFVEGQTGFNIAVENIDSYNFKPENRHFVKDYANNYIKLAKEAQT